MARREQRGGAVKITGLVQVAGGFSQSVSAGSKLDPATGKRERLQFRLKIAIDESLGSPEARRALALSRLADLLAMRDALVAVDRGEEAEYLLRQAGAVASDIEKFNFALAAAQVVMTRPSEQPNEARAKYSTWGQLATAWATQALGREYPNAGYEKRSGEATDKPRVEFLCKYIGSAPLATFNDDDYWRAMRPARQRCKTDTTFKAYSQVVRRVIKIAVELKIIQVWPLGATCKLPRVAKGSAPEFPFLYPDEYVRLMRCPLVELRYRVLWGFIIREGLRISEAFRIRWEHLTQLPNGRWLLDVPDTKTGRALNFVLNVGTGEVLDAFRRVPVTPEAPPLRFIYSGDRRSLGNKLSRQAVPAGELSGPFAWLKPSNLKNAAKQLRKHVEMSGTTRSRLLLTNGRLRRLREHDLRSTFVSWCKLAGIDNETISQHTGHESAAMIARYNRSKATIEHLGLPPYMTLEQAMGLDVSGELAQGELAPRLLGAGEPEPVWTCPGCRWADQHAEGCPHDDSEGDRYGHREPVANYDEPEPFPGAHQTSAAGAEALPPSPHAAAGELGAGSADAVPLPAPGGAPCTEPREPGCTCQWEAGDSPCPVHGEDEDALAPARASGAGRVAPPDAPQRPREPAQGRAGRRAPTAEPAARARAATAAQRRPAGHVEVHARVDYAPGDDANLVHPGSSDPRGITDGAGGTGTTEGPVTPRDGRATPRDGLLRRVTGAPLRSGRDAGRDALSRMPRATRGEERESGGFDAGARGEGRTPIPVRVLEPKSDLERQERTNPEDLGGEPAQETTGTGAASHLPVTLLGQLQAAAEQALAEHNWAALQALQPVIEAEKVRLSNEAAARRAQAEPVRLEVVRARRDGGAK